MVVFLSLKSIIQKILSLENETLMTRNTNLSKKTADINAQGWKMEMLAVWLAFYHNNNCFTKMVACVSWNPVLIAASVATESRSPILDEAREIVDRKPFSFQESLLPRLSTGKKENKHD